MNGVKDCPAKGGWDYRSGVSCRDVAEECVIGWAKLDILEYQARDRCVICCQSFHWAAAIAEKSTPGSSWCMALMAIHESASATVLLFPEMWLMQVVYYSEIAVSCLCCLAD